VLCYSLFVLQEHVKFTFTSTVTNNLFETCEPVKLLLISEDMKHWETT